MPSVKYQCQSERERSETCGKAYTGGSDVTGPTFRRQPNVSHSIKLPSDSPGVVGMAGNGVAEHYQTELVTKQAVLLRTHTAAWTSPLDFPGGSVARRFTLLGTGMTSEQSVSLSVS